LSNTENPVIPPWILEININTSLSYLSKCNTLHRTYKNELQSILDNFQGFSIFYTDGSKSETGVGAAVVCNQIKVMLKLHNACSIVTAEAMVISHVLYINKTNEIKKAIIFNDSLSTLNSIKSYKQPNGISSKILNQI